MWLQVFGCGSGSDPLWFLLQIEALKLFTQVDLVSWFLEQRNSCRKLSVHVGVATFDKHFKTDVFPCLCPGGGLKLFYFKPDAFRRSVTS